MRKLKDRIVYYVVLMIILSLPFAFPLVWTQLNYYHIEEDEAITVIAHYDYCKIETGGGISPLNVYFFDHEPLSAFWDEDAIKERLDSLVPGTELEIKVHPCHNLTGNNRIMSIQCGQNSICDFEDTMRHMTITRRGMVLFALLIVSIYIAIWLHLSNPPLGKHKEWDYQDIIEED